MPLAVVDFPELQAAAAAPKVTAAAPPRNPRREIPPALSVTGETL